jgi:hydroxymethylglutaryl-CoA lyase
MRTGTIEIVEVSPRDGLQNEPVAFSTAQKIELAARAAAAGVRRMEVTSFVNPQRVPQMADAEAVMAGVAEFRGLVPIALVLNRRGLERALRAGVREINVVVVASDTFSRRNQGVDTMAGLAAWADIARDARAAGVRISAVIAAAFGCPFEGEVPAARVADLAARIGESGPDELALADTIGVAAPADVTQRFAALAAALPGVALRGHFHNTRNTGLANAYAALQCGVTALDASLGGLGGCPFAPGATGNIPTEDLAYMLQRMGHLTDLSLERLLEAAAWLEARLGRQVPAMLGRAGLFPRRSNPT